MMAIQNCMLHLMHRYYFDKVQKEMDEYNRKRKRSGAPKKTLKGYNRDELLPPEFYINEDWQFKSPKTQFPRLDEKIKKRNEKIKSLEIEKMKRKEKANNFAEEMGIAGRYNFASNELFKFVYSSFLETERKIDNLINMKNKYINMKFASSDIKNIDELMLKILSDFEKKFFI